MVVTPPPSLSSLHFTKTLTSLTVGMIIIAGFAFQNGDPRRLIYGTDSWGNLCGVDNPNLVAGVPNSGLDFTNQRLLYYHDPSDSDALRVCVAACPNVDQTCTGTGDCGTGAINVCLTTNGYDNSGEPGAFDCPASVYVSANSLNIRRCVPANAGESSVAIVCTVARGPL